jgi:hypothetical protein
MAFYAACLYQHYSLSGVFLGCAAMALLWLGFAVTMRELPYDTRPRFIRLIWWQRWFNSVRKYCLAVQ